MIAFDTNLLVRALVADNDEQVAVVRQLIVRDTIFVSCPVLLETEWVLRAPAATQTPPPVATPNSSTLS